MRKKRFIYISSQRCLLRYVPCLCRSSLSKLANSFHPTSTFADLGLSECAARFTEPKGNEEGKLEIESTHFATCLNESLSPFLIHKYMSRFLLYFHPPFIPTRTKDTRVSHCFHLFRASHAFSPLYGLSYTLRSCDAFFFFAIFFKFYLSMPPTPISFFPRFSSCFMYFDTLFRGTILFSFLLHFP